MRHHQFIIQCIIQIIELVFPHCAHVFGTHDITALFAWTETLLALSLLMAFQTSLELSVLASWDALASALSCSSAALQCHNACLNCALVRHII